MLGVNTPTDKPTDREIRIMTEIQTDYYIGMQTILEDIKPREGKLRVIFKDPPKKLSSDPYSRPY